MQCVVRRWVAEEKRPGLPPAPSHMPGCQCRPPRLGAVSESRLRCRKRPSLSNPIAPIPSLYPPLQVKVLREWDIQSAHRAANGAGGVAFALQIVRHECFASTPLPGVPIAGRSALTLALNGVKHAPSQIYAKGGKP